MPSTPTDRLRGLTTSVAVKSPVRVASTGNLVLSSTQVIDGIAVSTGDRVLVKDQTVATENGIYEVDSATWSRAADFDGQRDCVKGTLVYVSTGVFYGNRFFAVTSTGINVPDGSSTISLASAGVFGSTITVSTFAETLLDDSSASDMRTTLSVAGTTSTNAFLAQQTFSTGVDLVGGQIIFPATQVPSADANTLDDYEEGTWTPVLTFATPGDLDVVYTTQVGTYSKIGRDVRVTGNIRTTTFTHTTASGLLKITGLPFTAANVTGLAHFGGFACTGITKATYTNFAAVVTPNTAEVQVYASGSAVGVDNVTANDMPSGASTVRLHFTVTYNV